ncbi:peptidase s41 family protein [Moniliophthora roreri]|nr:peptidase s41 family protein [Moniliophthora roreri]
MGSWMVLMFFSSKQSTPGVSGDFKANSEKFPVFLEDYLVVLRGIALTMPKEPGTPPHKHGR